MYLRTQCWGGDCVGWTHQFRALCHQMVIFMQSLGGGGDGVPWEEEMQQNLSFYRNLVRYSSCSISMFPSDVIKISYLRGDYSFL